MQCRSRNIYKKTNVRKKYLISGSNGYIGSSLTYYLNEQKNYLKTIGFGNQTDIKFNFGKRNKQINLNLKNNFFDNFIHLEMRNEILFSQNPYKANIENLNSIINAINITKKYNIKRLIYFSSYHVYKNDKNNTNENSTLFANNLYSNNHLFSENLIKNLLKNNQYLIFRVPNIYGLYGQAKFKRSTLLPFHLCDQILNNREIVLISNGSQFKNFVSIKSILHFININKFKNNIINLAGKDNISIYNFSKKIIKNYKELTSMKAQLKYNKKDKKNYTKQNYKSNYFKPKYDDLNNFIKYYLKLKI